LLFAKRLEFMGLIESEKKKPFIAWLYITVWIIVIVVLIAYWDYLPSYVAWSLFVLMMIGAPDIHTIIRMIKDK